MISSMDHGIGIELLMCKTNRRYGMFCLPLGVVVGFVTGEVGTERRGKLIYLTK